MEYRELQELECIYDRCEDCPHWTGTECDGDLPKDSEKTKKLKEIFAGYIYDFRGMEV